MVLVPVKGEIAKPINDTLSAILNGNEAIAKKGTGGLAAGALGPADQAALADGEVDEGAG